MPNSADEKLALLRSRLAVIGPAAIAFSGGVDSSFLVVVAREVLGRDGCVALTCRGDIFPRDEEHRAAHVCEKFDIRSLMINFDPLAIAEFRHNGPERCYYCKKEIATLLFSAAREKGFTALLDGSIADDATDYRPGTKALREAGILSPLAECGLTKRDVRTLSEKLSIPTFSTPASPCYASRIPYGTEISEDVISRVRAAEEFLHSLGYSEVRVRHHDSVARIEIPAYQIPEFVKTYSLQVSEVFHRLGYAYASVDLQGLRSGSLNEVL